jgi:hypothetical protein
MTTAELSERRACRFTGFRRGGGIAMRGKRRLSPASGDRFLRWAELESFERVVRVVEATDLQGSAWCAITAPW